MAIGGVNCLSRGVPHQGFADFLQDTGFHHSAVKGVPEIVESVVADSRPTDRTRPGRFDLADGLAFESENESVFFPLRLEKLGEPSRKRNLTGLALGRFRVRDKKNLAVEVDMLPTL